MRVFEVIVFICVRMWSFALVCLSIFCVCKLTYLYVCIRVSFLCVCGFLYEFGLCECVFVVCNTWYIWCSSYNRDFHSYHGKIIFMPLGIVQVCKFVGCFTGLSEPLLTICMLFKG